MRTTIFAIAVAALAGIFCAMPARAQHHDGQYSYSWNHAHQHTCGEYSEYPWTRCQSRDAHEQALLYPEMKHSCEVTECGERGCGSCGQGHCSSQHMYRKNLDLIRDLRCDYCIPQAAVEKLCRWNESAYHTCRMYPAGTCFQCSQPAGCAGKPTLEGVHAELASLKTKCFVQTHK
jgi:hypothetical protein